MDLRYAGEAPRSTLGWLDVFGVRVEAASGRIAKGGGGVVDAIPARLYTIPPRALMIGDPEAFLARHPGGGKVKDQGLKGAVRLAGLRHDIPFDRTYGIQSTTIYMDPMGLSWVLWLGVEGYLLHPDNGNLSTLGCIKVVKEDTYEIFMELARRADQPMTLLASQK